MLHLRDHSSVLQEQAIGDGQRPQGGAVHDHVLEFDAEPLEEVQSTHRDRLRSTRSRSDAITRS